jgi:Neprosin/CARDB
MLGANGAQVSITTSFYTDTKRVDIPPGISIWTWNVTAPAQQAAYTVTVRAYDHFCGAWVEGSGSFTIGSVNSLPDLISTAIQYNPAELVPGRMITFDSGVQNTGPQGTGGFNVKWFVDGVLVGYGSHGGVPANGTVLDGNSVYTWVATAGAHTITFVVDVDNHVMESNESNNSRQITVTPDCNVSPEASGYWYVIGYQCFPAVGAYAKMSQHQPWMGFSGVHSLAEIGVRNDFSNGVDAIEVGWTVSPVQFNDDLPHLFVFRTIGSQEQGGCYVLKNGDCGWVQVSNKEGHRPGDPVTVTSNPEQYGIYYYQGNWWVNYQNDWIGYFPASLWPNNRFIQFARVGWWGEVSAQAATGSCTQMGNGTYGSQPNSAVITDIGFINFDGSQTQANIIPYVTDPSYYDVGNFTGHSFSYGGPGKFLGQPICQYFPH